MMVTTMAMGDQAARGRREGDETTTGEGQVSVDVVEFLLLKHGAGVSVAHHTPSIC